MKPDSRCIKNDFGYIKRIRLTGSQTSVTTVNPTTNINLNPPRLLYPLFFVCSVQRPSTSVDGPRSIPRRGLKSRLLQFASNYGYAFVTFFSPCYCPNAKRASALAAKSTQRGRHTLHTRA